MNRIVNWLCDLHGEFGTRGCFLIVAATVALAPIPVPGTVLIPIAVAKRIRRYWS